MRARLAVLCIFLAAAAAGCGEVKEELLLPWFKVRRIEHWGPAGFGGSSGEERVYVKRWGFWWTRLEDGLGGARVIDDDSVIYGGSGQMRLIHRGETAGVSACAANAGVGVPPLPGVYDCYEITAAVGGRWPATQIRHTRLDGRRRQIFERTMAVEAPGRIFERAMASYYDDAGTAYFVTTDDHTKGVPQQCVLVWVEAGGLKALPLPSRGACPNAGGWQKLLGRNLSRT